MKKSILGKLIFFVLFVGCFITACNDDDSPFKGTDNNVLSFSLVEGNNTWHAAIAKDEIIVNVPEGTELNNAKVSHTLSEQATISPDPTTIARWDEEQQFTVTSYSGQSHSYTYRIQYSAVSETGNFTLNSQSDVEAFAKRNLSVIEGNLQIAIAESAEDPVTNLNSLKLKEVIDEVRIGAYYKGENLSGLSSLEKAGSVVINRLSNDVALENISFSALTFIRKDLMIENSVSIQNINFPYLETILGNIELYAENVSKFNMNSLKRIGGSFTYNNDNKLSVLEFPFLEAVGEKFSIKRASGTGFANLGTVNLPELSNCKNVSLSECESLENLKIPKLQTIPGSLTFKQCPAFSDINTVIKNAGSIDELELSRTNVSDLNSKGKIIKKFTLSLNTNKQFTITGDEVFGDINFSSDQAPLPLFKDITTVGDYTVKTAQASFTLTGIKKITGTLKTSPIRVENMTEVNLSDLESIGTLDMHIGKNGTAVSFKAPNLTKIEGAFNLSIANDQPDLSFLDMPNLKTIGYLYIKGKSTGSNAAPNITKIDCFSHLESINKVYIQFFKNLSDFSDFKVFADRMTESENWKVASCKSNPTLQEMQESATGNF